MYTTVRSYERLKMAISGKQKRELRGQAHSLRPVIIIGSKGLTAAVHQEINIALEAHELIKIKIHDHDKATIKKMIPEICTTNGAEHIQTIGHTVCIWRKKTT